MPIEPEEIVVRQVVVTGGGTGIGYAVAAAFRDAGDAVTITGRRPDVLREAALRLGATPVVFDASDHPAVTAAMGELPPQIDVLVNNAGGNTPTSTDPIPTTSASWLPTGGRTSRRTSCRLSWSRPP